MNQERRRRLWWASFTNLKQSLQQSKSTHEAEQVLREAKMQRQSGKLTSWHIQTLRDLFHGLGRVGLL
jgi:hypothetical protein